MKPETISLDIPVYRDPEGKETCARDFSKGESCPFIRTKVFGTIEYCAYTGHILGRYDNTFLKPSDGCPVWKQTVKPMDFDKYTPSEDASAIRQEQNRMVRECNKGEF